MGDGLPDRLSSVGSLSVQHEEDQNPNGSVSDPNFNSAPANLEVNNLGVMHVTGNSKISAEVGNNSCIIDVKSSCRDEEKVCRICHLSSDQTVEMSVLSKELISIGCNCKNELGLAHLHCAEAWFKLKGNRLCEICGGTAKNIKGIGENMLVSECSGRGVVGGRQHDPSERGRGCLKGHPLCNFLMACLVVAFVLPWFFRVNMF